MVRLAFQHQHKVVYSDLFIEPTYAYAQWALKRRFLSVCHLTKSHWTIIHISVSIVARVMKFGMEMHLGAMQFDLEVQGQRSRLPGQKMII